MDKRGLELSINFIIILILAIITLAMGILIFNMIFRSGTELEKEVSQQTKDQINNLLMEGDKKVLIPSFFKELESGDQHAFGLGIRNYGNRQEFTILIEFDLAVDRENNDKTSEAVASHEVDKWHFEQIGPIVIDSNDLEVVSVPIRPGNRAKNGWIYVFNVEVLDGSDLLHGNIQKIYVKII